mgnify:CR=1 FL=1
MKVGDLVKVPRWQEKRSFWKSISDVPGDVGLVFDMTPYTVHVRWTSGKVSTMKLSTAGCLEVVA